MQNRIKELIESYPEVDLGSEDIEIIQEMARRYLKSEHDQLYGLGRPIHNNRNPLRTRTRNIERITMDREKVSAAVSNAVASIVRKEALTLRNEWLPLMAEKFALPDGTIVTWATATKDQHGLRAGFLEAHASGELQTASLHRKAIDDIRQSDERTLADIELVAA